jgi:hypothetical protein
MQLHCLRLSPSCSEEGRSVLRKILLLVVTGIAGAGLVMGLAVTFEHLDEAGFPHHARFHAALSGSYLTLLAALALWLTLEAWRGMPFTLLRWLAVLAVPLGVVIAAALVPAGAPPAPFPWIAAGGLLLALIVGGWLWRHDAAVPRR